GVFETTIEGRFSAVNPALARMLGFTNQQDMVSSYDHVARDLYVDPKRREEFIRALDASDRIVDFESEVRCGDGSTKWVSENVRAVRDAQKRLLHFQGFVSDVTERRRAHDALRASEERYRVLFEQSPVAIIEFDYRKAGAWLDRVRAQGVTDLEIYFENHPEEVGAEMRNVELVAMNEETARLLRAPSKEHAMENFADVLASDGWRTWQKTFHAIWAGRCELEGEAVVAAFDGSSLRTYYRWWLPRINGRPVYEWTQLVLVDLTEIRRAEAALAAERERLGVTLRAMAEAVITADPDGVVQFINHAAEVLTGWAGGSALGRKIAEVCVLRHEKTRTPILVPVSTALAEDRVIELPLQTTLMSREGMPCLIEGRCAPMHGTNKQAVGAVLVLRDVTEHARLETEIQRASQLESIGILAGGIAHDFNNILTVVMGHLALAMSESQSASGKWLREAESGVLRARDLTQQLLTFSKGGEPLRAAVLLPEVVQEAAQFALHGSKVLCEFQADPGLWAADVDKGQIGQVVQNLVINAVQAMPDGGTIKISLHNETIEAVSARGDLAAGHYLKIVIADTGHGILPEWLSRIFEPYFTTKKSGSGLGLATVYSIIKKHKGHIEVESEPGRGTVFCFWLPAAQERPAEPADPGKTFSPMIGRVLFMDDEESLRVMAETLLRRLGFEVTVVNDGLEAVREYEAARAAGQPYDLVVLDLTVPGGMGGQETLEQLLKIDPNVRAVVSSGYSSNPVLADHRAHGFVGRLAKPYRVTDLAKVMRSALEGLEID
ncbi:MAG: PAS domain S-box protein, partial [Verrucomicrobiota bacterium]|nr:PAS domain S-box protein [Verrucomicrobiota bacterium]